MHGPRVARGALSAQASRSQSTLDSRFNRHAERLAERHGAKVWRLGLDGGFGCPNRLKGDCRGSGGCSYCASSGALAPYLAPEARADASPGSPEALASLAHQVSRGLSFTRRRYGASLFFLYFQAYSSTWAPVETLRASYDAAFAALEAEAPGSARGLVVSTRPDCVNGDTASLLEEYASRGLEVWVELGLQSGNDATLERIHRGHTVADFVAARRILKRPGLRVAAHLILGLPGEDGEAALAGPRLVAELGLDGVKFHDLHVPRSSALAEDYLSGGLSLLSEEGYVGLLADSIELLPPSMEVIRLCTETDQAERLAPQRNFDKNVLAALLETELAGRGARQGSRAQKSRLV